MTGGSSPICGSAVGYCTQLACSCILLPGHRRRRSQPCAELGCVHHMQVYCAAPQTLLPVLPHLSRQLGLEDESRRLAAVNLLGPLFSTPGSQLDAENTHLFTELLRRFTDQKVPMCL